MAVKTPHGTWLHSKLKGLWKRETEKNEGQCRGKKIEREGGRMQGKGGTKTRDMAEGSWVGRESLNGKVT